MSETAAQRQRAKEFDRIERLGVTPLPSPFVARVVGVTFAPGYPDNLHQLAALAREEGHREEGIPALIVRNPDNAYDANACEVHVPAIGMIGHLPAPVAARLAPDLDAGDTWQAEVVDVLINPDHLDRPGISVRLARITEEG